MTGTRVRGPKSCPSKRRTLRSFPHLCHPIPGVNLNQEPSPPPPSNREKRRGKEKAEGGAEEGWKAIQSRGYPTSYPRRLTSRTHRTGRRVRQTVFARPDHLELINVGQGQAAACGRIKAPPRKLRGSNPFLFPLPLVIGRGRTPDFVSNE